MEYSCSCQPRVVQALAPRDPIGHIRDLHKVECTATASKQAVHGLPKKIMLQASVLFRDTIQDNKTLFLKKKKKEEEKPNKTRCLGSTQEEKEEISVPVYPQPCPRPRCSASEHHHLLTSQIIINPQDPHLQQIHRDNTLTVCLELPHVLLRVDGVAAEALGAGEGEVEGWGRE